MRHVSNNRKERPDPTFPPNALLHGRTRRLAPIAPLGLGLPRGTGAMDGHRSVYKPTCTYTHRHNNHAEQLSSVVQSVAYWTTVLHLNSPFPSRLFFLGAQVRIPLNSHFNKVLFPGVPGYAPNPSRTTDGQRLVCPVPQSCQWMEKLDRLYVLSRRYNSSFCDIVPTILSNTLAVNITILQHPGISTSYRSL